MNFNLAEAKRKTGLSYLGKVNNGAKHHKAFKYGELVYTIYLAPANMSGYEVCPGRTPECTALCLNESGHNRGNYVNTLSFINDSRVKKTQMFFEQHDFFCQWVVRDINAGIAKAKKEGKRFSVRINNTSDISPEQIYIKENGVKKNILELFPETMFYDYTKIAGRVQLMKKYPNYDITYSYNGMNWDQCERMLNNNVRVAVVFDQIPDYFRGFKVINGDLNDLRYRDPKNVIIGLKYKKSRNTPDENTTFVVRTKELVKEEVF
jgi:hypothetical protein